MAPAGIRRSVVVAAIAAAAGLGGPRLAAAEGDRVALIWNAPAGCPTAQAIQDEVSRSVKRVVPVAAAVNVVAPSPPPSNDRWRASLVIHSHGKRAERQFDAESCEALAAAAALIIGLAAEGADDATPPPSAGEVQPPAAGRAENAIAAAPPPGPAKPASAWDDAGPHVVVAGALDSDTMPGGAAPGIEAAAGQSWTTSAWRLRLTAGASFFPERDMGPDPMIFGVPYGKFWLVSFSARGCLTAVISRFEIGPCLGGELAFMHSTGLGGPTATDTQYWASPLGSAVAGLTVASRVVVYARTDVVFPSTQRSFNAVSPAGDINFDIYKIPAHALRAVLGVELRF